MRIAIISDVHGNYPALEKVIDDAVTNNVDMFIFIGDYIFDLPFSNEVVRTIMGLENTYIVKGNKETYLDGLRKENQEEWTSKQMGGIYQTYRELSDDVFDFLIGLQEECFIPLDSGKVIYATHYLKGIEQQAKMSCGSSKFHENMLRNPFSHQKYLAEFKETLKQDYFNNTLDRINAHVILFGHNHLQGYGYSGEKLVINPGACGQPLDFNHDASYTILEENANGFDVMERRVPYDIESTIDTAKESSIYASGGVWSELCFLAMRTGRDYFGIFFGIANEIKASKGEVGSLFSNETWEEAYEVFLRMLRDTTPKSIDFDTSNEEA